MADIQLTQEELGELADVLVPMLVPLLRNQLTPLSSPLAIVPSTNGVDARDLLSWLSEHELLKDDYGRWDEDSLDTLYADFIDKQRPGFSDVS